MTASAVPLSATPRRSFWVLFPCTQQRSITISRGSCERVFSEPPPSLTTPVFSLTPGATVSSMPIKRHWCAPGAASTAPSKLGLTMRAMCGASPGPARTPAGRVPMSEVRTTISPEPAFLGSTKLPVKVAPASSTTWSPGTARSSAACRSSPLCTRIKPPVGGT